MQYYPRTHIEDTIAIQSLVTIYHIDLYNRSVSGDVHDFPEIFYADKGDQTTFLDGKPYLLKESELIIYAPNCFHGPKDPSSIPNTFSGEIGIVSFETDSTLLNALYNKPLPLTARQRELFSEIITRGLSLFESTKSEGGHIAFIPDKEHKTMELLYIKKLLELFLISLYASHTQKASKPIATNNNNYESSQMDAITKYFQNHLNSMLSLEQISVDLGYSIPKLRRIVSEQKGCGIIDYFISLKITEAKRLIRESSMNITEISEQLGFNSVHYFSKQFKKRTGKSPLAYAKSIDKR